jgi:hypothetical protein
MDIATKYIQGFPVGNNSGQVQILYVVPDDIPIERR